MSTATEGTSLLRKRVYVGGLASTVTAEELQDRFKSFGKVENTSLALSADGFAHFDLITNDTQWKRCVSAYNGSSWRGGRLRIEEARAHYQLQFEARNQAGGTGAGDSQPKKRHRPRVRHAGDMSLMTDGKVNQRKGWRHGRFGRAVAVIRMKRPNGSFITVDPSHYKNNIEKLFGSVKPLPISRLTWTEPADDKMVVEISSEAETDDFTGQTRTAVHNDDSLRSETLECGMGDEPKEDSSLAENITGSTENQDGPSELTQTPRPTGFYLSNLLNLELPSVSPSAAIDAAEDISILPDDSPAAPKPLQVADLLFDMAQLHTLTVNEIAFCRRSGKEEARMLWQEKRPILRADYKNRLKQARRLFAERSSGPRKNK